MVESKIFNFSLVISFLGHVLALGSLYYSNVHYKKERPKTIEVVYHIEPQKIEVEPPQKKKLKSIKERSLPPEPEILTKKTTPSSSILNKIAKQPVKLEIAKKGQIKLPVLEGKKLISVPMLKSDKIKNPKYINYNDLIRSKIKNRAYHYIDNPDFESGEVYLTFVIGADGNLKQTKINNDRTMANDYLRTVGLRSIKESSPFPSFPKDLKYPELSFNVIISFEVQ